MEAAKAPHAESGYNRNQSALLGNGVGNQEEAERIYEAMGVLERNFPGWKLVVMAPMDELYSAVDAMVVKGIVLSLGILLLATLLISLYSFSFSKSIKEFAHNLSYLAQGDFTKPVKVRSRDELGQIGYLL